VWDGDSGTGNCFYTTGLAGVGPDESTAIEGIGVSVQGETGSWRKKVYLSGLASGEVADFLYDDAF
jgi:hypothetical protein